MCSDDEIDDDDDSAPAARKRVPSEQRASAQQQEAQNSRDGTNSISSVFATDKPRDKEAAISSPRSGAPTAAGADVFARDSVRESPAPKERGKGRKKEKDNIRESLANAKVFISSQ